MIDTQTLSKERFIMGEKSIHSFVMAPLLLFLIISTGGREPRLGRSILPEALELKPGP